MISVISSKGSPSYSGHFRQSTLTKTEIENGCRLEIDSWSVNSFSGKHSYVDGFVQGEMLEDTGFYLYLGYFKDLPIPKLTCILKIGWNHYYTRSQ